MYLNCSNEEWLNLVKDVLSLKKPLYVRLYGESMYPTIKDSELVKIEPLTGKVKIKEIILYKDDRGKPIVHRVVKMMRADSRMKYLARSDSSWYGGDIIEEEQILGRVTFIRRGDKDIAVGQLKARYLYIIFRRSLRLVAGILEKLRFRQYGKAVKRGV